MLKGDVEPVIMLTTVLIISITGIVIVWEQTKPTLQTSLEARATFVSHILASYASGLSTIERGKIEKDLNGSYDIEIGMYPWSKRTFTSITPLANYYIKTTAYDEKWEKKKDSGQVPFVGELSVTCGSGMFKAAKCMVLKNVSFITLLKEPNKPVEILPAQKFTITPMSVSNNFIASYNMYRDVIEKSVAKYDFSPYYDRPKALVAGLISQESGWKKEAVSYCGSAGIMQFTPQTARDYGLNVPKYDFEECNIQLCGKKVSSCNACTAHKCDLTNDERFDPYKSIEAGVHLLYDNIKRCGSVEGGLRMYNSGKCYEEANPGYVSRVLGYAEEWKKYV